MTSFSVREAHGDNLCKHTLYYYMFSTYLFPLIFQFQEEKLAKNMIIIFLRTFCYSILIISDDTLHTILKSETMCTKVKNFLLFY